MVPGVLPDVDPFLLRVASMRRTKGDWIRRREESRVLDCRQNMEIGESPDNREENDSFNGRIGCMNDERPQYGAHFG